MPRQYQYPRRFSMADKHWNQRSLSKRHYRRIPVRKPGYNNKSAQGRQISKEVSKTIEEKPEVGGTNCQIGTKDDGGEDTS